MLHVKSGHKIQIKCDGVPMYPFLIGSCTTNVFFQLSIAVKILDVELTP